MNLPYAGWGMSRSTLVLMMFIFSAIPFAACVLAARFAVKRLPPMAALLVFPASWTAYEFFFSRVQPNGTMFNLAYSQVNVLPLIQIASITGIWGITFVITLIPSAVAIAWARRAPSALMLAGAVAVLVAGYGSIRLQAHSQEPEIRVGLAASDLDTVGFSGDPAKVIAVAQHYAERVSRLAADGAKLVVLPEALLPITPDDSRDVLQIVRDVARAAHVTLVVGMSRSGRLSRNIAAVISPEGEVLAEYKKRHLVPVIERNTEAGAVPGLLAAPLGKWGVAICKDMDFPESFRDYGRYGAQILAVPAWDFGSDGLLHARMAVLRGVENGFSIARAANGGVVAVYDAYGRIVAERSSSGAAGALLVHDVALGPGHTLYSQLGDWFPVSCLISLIVLLSLSVYRKKPTTDNSL
jgi:apolipoprotein N-acyltransferase